jgi:hypothetical protein
VHWFCKRFLRYAHSEGFDDNQYAQPKIILPSKDEILDPNDDASQILICELNVLEMAAPPTA